MKRLKKWSKADIEKLELQYRKLIDKPVDTDESNYVLKNQVNDDKKTFFLTPGNLLVDYDDNLLSTDMRPGPYSPWSQSDRWIGR